MRATVRYAAAGTALALLTAAIPATYAINGVINPAKAECATTGGRLLDVAFLNTFMPNWTEGVPTAVNKDALQFTMDGQIYTVKHRSELEWITPGEKVNVAYVIDGGRRYVTEVKLQDPELHEDVELAIATHDNPNGLPGKDEVPAE